MSRKSLVILGALIGSVIGGFIPALWGGGAFGNAAIITSTIGGLLGIWGAVKLSPQ